MKKAISVLMIFLMLAVNFLSVTCFAADKAEWIYYSNSNDLYRPYRIKCDGTGMTRLSLDTAYDLTPLGGYIYYHNDFDPGGILRTKKDGSQTEVIADSKRNYFRGMANNDKSVFILYETNYNAEDCEYVEPDLMLCIFDKKGERREIRLTYYDAVRSGFVNIAGADEKYLYFSVKNGDNVSYQKMKLTSDGNVQFEKCKESELPKTSEQTPKIPDNDHFRNKYLCWEKVDDAINYRIFRKNKANGKYKKIAETTDTYADLCVKASEYDDEYKVSAVKEKDGKHKLYKVTMSAPPKHIFGNTAGNLFNSPFAAAHGNFEYVSQNHRIYKINAETNKKEEFRSGGDGVFEKAARSLNLYDDKLFFTEDNSSLCCIDTEGKNIDIMSDFLKSVGIEKDYLHYYEFNIYSIAVCDGILYVSYYFEPDSAPCHTAAFDIESKQSEIINNYPASGIGFAENKIIFISDSDKSIYSTNFNSKETVHISEEPAQSMYIDSENEKIYFCNPNGIFTSEFDGTSCRKIYDGEIISINSDGEKLYFIRNDPYRKTLAWENKYTAWSIDFDGKSPEMLTEISGRGDVVSLNIIGDKMYVLFTNEEVNSYIIDR